MTKEYVGVEVEPVLVYKDEDGQEQVEVTTPAKAHYWSIYLRKRDGTAEWVKDYRASDPQGRRDAMEFARKLARERSVPFANPRSKSRRVLTYVVWVEDEDAERDYFCVRMNDEELEELRGILNTAEVRRHIADYAIRLTESTMDYETFKKKYVR